MWGTEHLSVQVRGRGPGGGKGGQVRRRRTRTLQNKALRRSGSQKFSTNALPVLNEHLTRRKPPSNPVLNAKLPVPSGIRPRACGSAPRANRMP